MKNIMIREDVYLKVKELKGTKSFSEIIEELAKSKIETRKRNLRSYFGTYEDKQSRELEKSISEVLRIAKGRLF
ncbi:MAG: antitoxin [Candidatus Altiarchaeota archaeon]|nr:antitoxin [Candidatus Altiarchaeota archaeon]